jgi:hypothetical protein
VTITSLEMLETAIAQLQTLAAFLDDQLGQVRGAREPSFVNREARACKEALVSLRMLIPRLQAARARSPRLE